ncbi:putative deoxyribonuclease TATDN2 [Mercenaria mercenaria]|uniref:putative deoxyribonuclease TATDN2 n=1 Tax=Mercenaria mercenaria TaxID=6596 RepID=UPI00234EF112|nr:putative deoxyribonuclease TATDN2 [Mercenaria mercenaria]
MTCSPFNSPGCVFHYQVMLQVVILLGERGNYEFMRRFSLPERREELEARCPRPEGSKELELLECPKPSSTGASPVRNLRVERYVEGGREVFLVHQLEGESCSTSAVAGSSTSVVALPEGVIDAAEVTSSLDQEVHSLSDSSVSISPRRSWRPAPSPEPQLSDMEVVDEVAGGEDDGNRVRSQKEALSLECVDSHFHLDTLCQNYTVELPEGLADGETLQQVAKLRKERVVSVIGIHPSKVHEDGVVRRLKEKLDECDVMGLGEIGIDGTKKDLPLQRTVFDEVLGLLESRSHLVLVLHCRPGRGQVSSSSYFELCYRCKAALRPEQKIHLHCLNGTMEDVDLCVGYFPNTHFGYSLMVQRADFKADSRSTLRRTDSSRLLESDAPYFKYDNEQEWSSPSFIGLTAQEVARVRGRTRDELLKITAQNAQRLYWW